MSISKSSGAYQDCRDLFEKADEDEKGCRIFIGAEGDARHFVMRMHQARELIRKENKLLYEFGHPMHGTSIYDKFKCSKKQDPQGKWWVYVQKIELDLSAVENLSELVDYEFVEPAPQIERRQTLVIEHQATQSRELIIRRRV